MTQTDAPTPSANSETPQSQVSAVLVSGGLDSAILLAETTTIRSRVQPIYIRSGLQWENDELRHLHQFLAAIRTPSLEPLTILNVPVAELYGNHWSISGRDVPSAQTSDEAVYLPGRNVLLLTKAMLWCQLHSVNELALGTLKSNPFPDATPTFFAEFEATINSAIGGTVQIVRPFADMSKREVMQRGSELPLHLTFSCIRPSDGIHCGTCNKCAERRRAFIDAQMPDPTTFASEKPCTV